jgi:hypothetical protein
VAALEGCGSELAAMVQEATIDGHDEDEQAMGFYDVIADALKLPFVTSVLGVDVTVEGVDIGVGNDILAICVRGGIRQAIRVVNLPLPEPPPAGAAAAAADRLRCPRRGSSHCSSPPSPRLPRAGRKRSFEKNIPLRRVSGNPDPDTCREHVRNFHR